MPLCNHNLAAPTDGVVAENRCMVPCASLKTGSLSLLSASPNLTKPTRGLGSLNRETIRADMSPGIALGRNLTEPQGVLSCGKQAHRQLQNNDFACCAWLGLPHTQFRCI